MKLFLKKYLNFFVLLPITCVFIFTFQNSFAATTQSQITPIGLWKSLDDKTSEPRSIIEITEKNGHLSGKIVKIYYQDGEGPADVCHLCRGARNNKLILGMTIMTGLAGNGRYWQGGEVVDPSNGKVYHCKLKLSDDGNKLFLRGYIGISLFGRTQTWLRVNKF